MRTRSSTKATKRPNDESTSHDMDLREVKRHQAATITTTTTTSPPNHTEVSTPQLGHAPRLSLRDGHSSTQIGMEPFSLPGLPLSSKTFLPHLSPLNGASNGLSAFFLERPLALMDPTLPPSTIQRNNEDDNDSSSDSDEEDEYSNTTTPHSFSFNPQLAPLTTTLSHCHDLSAHCPPDHEPECAELVFLNLDSDQKRFCPDPTYTTRQPDINAHARHMLIDWLVEVADEFSLKSTTLFLTVSLIDRFLSRVNVDGEKRYIVGLAAMFIVSKVEEDCPPSLEEFVLTAENPVANEEVIEMEKEILNAVGFSVIAPTIHTFLRRLHRCCRIDPETLQLSNYLSELSLLNVSFLQFLPSVIAASAVALSQHAVSQTNWSEEFRRSSGHSFSELAECMTELLAVFQDASTNGDQKASRDKYTAPNPCLCVANIAPPDTIPPLPHPLPHHALPPP